jgi:hypothetical protein
MDVAYRDKKVVGVFVRFAASAKQNKSETFVPQTFSLN